jgi:hypothetical protein
MMGIPVFVESRCEQKQSILGIELSEIGFCMAN